LQGIFLMIDPVSRRVASAYWPGLALLMTPLAFFNAEWLLHPALSAQALWVTRGRVEAKRLCQPRIPRHSYHRELRESLIHEKA
jgi:hypothetical protein